jgi:Nickel responsive protein SCO4226-like
VELIPCGHVWPSTAYFRAGHLQLDSLIRSLAAHRQIRRQEHDMAVFMDFHEDLKLPAEAIAQIAEDTRNKRSDQFGVRQVELYHNPGGQVYCLLEGPDEDAIRRHHAALGVPCGDVHQVDSLA